MTFDEFWLSGPWRKLGKELARRRWKATVKTPADMEAITMARDRYHADLKRRFASREYDETKVLHGGTWFGVWREWHAMALDEQQKAEEAMKCDYCKSREHESGDCEERRKDYAELKKKIAAATAKLGMKEPVTPDRFSAVDREKS